MFTAGKVEAHHLHSPALSDVRDQFVANTVGPVADLELLGRDVATLLLSAHSLEPEDGLFAGVRVRGLVEQGERGVVILTVTIIDGLRHELAVLIEVEPEFIVFADFVRGQIDLQVHHLAPSH